MTETVGPGEIAKAMPGPVEIVRKAGACQLMMGGKEIKQENLGVSGGEYQCLVALAVMSAGEKEERVRDIDLKELLGEARGKEIKMTAMKRTFDRLRKQLAKGDYADLVWLDYGYGYHLSLGVDITMDGRKLELNKIPKNMGGWYTTISSPFGEVNSWEEPIAGK